MTTYYSNFIIAFEAVALQANDNATAKGFWEGERTEAEAIALMHSELSEALEGLREGNGPSEHIPEFTKAEEEYADVIIRIMDNGIGRGHNISSAVIAKIEYNKSRPKKHGKEF